MVIKNAVCDIIRVALADVPDMYVGKKMVLVRFWQVFE